MKTRWLTCFLSLSCVFTAQAESFVTVHSKEKPYTSEEVITLFGPKKSYPTSAGYSESWNTDVNADLNTNLECGKLQFASQFKDTLNKLKNLPENLVHELATDISVLESDAPILAICWTDPVICAELKNLDLKLQTNIGFNMNACQSINNFIDDQASKGKKEAYEKAYQSCMKDHMGSDGANSLEAVTACTKDVSATQGLVTNILQRQMNTKLSSAQNIIQASVQSVGRLATQDDQDMYQILNASIGEMKLNIDGSIVPVLPQVGKVYDETSISKSFLATSVNTLCDKTAFSNAVTSVQTSASTDPQLHYTENAVYQSIHTNLSIIDVTNLDQIDQVDREIICQVLGRSVAQNALEKFSAHGQNMMSLVIQNPYAPGEIRNMYKNKTGVFFSTLSQQLQSEDIYPIPIVRQEIANLARSVRQENQKLGSELSAENRKSSQWWDLTDLCNSVYTCQ